ncbi:LysM peptidoglycan-binding domain-containing protein [Desulfotomaculum sp. 1211_IL3151]|uniref:LysM peptidoglycan-binding domain-containing protein n=1 Tax=Desulfotomaculum sp. 1211_IL3151 TaxID=3084055 RepID=UPI002FDA1552
MRFLHRLKRVIVSLCLFAILMPSTALAAQYTVVPGDSLYLISQKVGVSITQIKTANGLTSDVLDPGHVLTIPEAKPTEISYTVKSGDSLYAIAQKFGVGLNTIMQVNGLTSSTIHPGKQLIIPGASVRNTAAPVAATVSRSAQRPVIPYDDEDFDLLARLVTAEAGGEPMEAQISVAAVVINRVQSSIFPNNIRDVIYAQNQFSPVRNGWINKPATANAIKAAQAALDGNDPTNGALYFFDKGSTNSFLLSLPVAANYGKMVYAKAK